ncbi:MAG: hypothetical protein H6719_05685 [Sandaracinaceae bacterium]|nr:hypothetical protein [Sandaracinaceae bacterium]
MRALISFGLVGVLLGCGAEPADPPETDSEGVMGEEPAPEPPERFVPRPPNPGTLDEVPAFEGSICAGRGHTCLVTDDGRVACVGANDHGQLGDGSQREQHDWVWVSGLDDVTQVACAGDKSCAVGRDGEVRCWGDNRRGDLVPGGDETLDAPTRVGRLTNVAAVSVGSWMGACALLRSGAIRCWGNLDLMGDPELEEARVGIPIAPLGVPPAAQIGVGETYACARTLHDNVHCWGRGSGGQLGRGSRTGGPSTEQVPGLDDVVDLAVGTRHACAVSRDGSLRCWGENQTGQIGDGDDGEAHRIPSQWSHGEGTELADALQPTRIELPPVREVSVAAEHTCALLARGGVACWGSNPQGALGAGSDASLINRPAGVRGVHDATHVVAGAGGDCAVRAGGALRCWGENESGQLGRDPGVVNEPVDVLPRWNAPAATTSQAIVFAPLDHPRRAARPRLVARDNDLCAIDTEGHLYCFGGDLGRRCATPRCGAGLVEALPDVIDVAFGLNHACAVRADGHVACWGSGESGQLGFEVSESAVPVPAAGVDDAVEVALGWDFTCVRHATGDVSCFGDRGASILGAEHEGVAREPVRIEGLSDVVQLVAGRRFACARRADGHVLCWGDGNNGTCGPEGHARQPTPIAIPEIDDAVDLVAGDDVACAIRGPARGVTCWGNDDDGLVPGPPSLRGVIRIGLGDEHACALFAGGVIRCWGRDVMGALGDGEAEDAGGEYPRPRGAVRTETDAVRALSPADDLSCGGHFCCAHHRSGEVSCWGDVPAVFPLEDGELASDMVHVPTPIPLLRLR